MRIRKSTRKDFLDIARLMKKEFIKPPYHEKWTIKNALRTINNYSRRGPLYVAVLDKKIIGFIITKYEPYAAGLTCIIEELIVDSDFQGKGVGRALVESVEKECKKKKVKSIHLSTSKRAPAFRFYTHLGYIASKHTVFLRKVLK